MSEIHNAIKYLREGLELLQAEAFRIEQLVAPVHIPPVQALTPGQLLRQRNKNDCDLQHCLFTVLLKLEAKDPKFPPDRVLPRQAKDFSVHVEDIYEAIKAYGGRMHSRYMSQPGTGYPQWYHDLDAPF